MDVEYDENVQEFDNQEPKDYGSLDSNPTQITEEVDTKSLIIEQEKPNPPGAKYAVVILTIINLLNFIDRYIPSATKDLFKVKKSLVVIN